MLWSNEWLREWRTNLTVWLLNTSLWRNWVGVGSFTKYFPATSECSKEKCSFFSLHSLFLNNFTWSNIGIESSSSKLFSSCPGAFDYVIWSSFSESILGYRSRENFITLRFHLEIWTSAIQWQVGKHHLPIKTMWYDWNPHSIIILKWEWSLNDLFWKAVRYNPPQICLRTGGLRHF